MTIGIDARLWFESGVGRYIRNTVIGLAKLTTEHKFVIFMPTEAYKSVRFDNPNFRKVKADVKWHTISEQYTFKSIIDRENVDLMHFPYFSYPVFYSKPFVITIHDLIIDHFPTGKTSSLPRPLYYFKRYGYRHIVKSAVKNAQKIITPSHDAKSEIIKHYHAKDSKIEVIYEGFDATISKHKTDRKLVSDNYLLYVGNAYPHKNLENLLRAIKSLRERIDVDLVCIGKQDFFYERLSTQLIPGVYFLHNVDDSELFDYYKGAITTVVPSLMEGFGLPLLESMSLSCPVVSSSASALREIGGDACLYFDPKSPDDIEKTLEKVINSKSLRDELIKKGEKQSKKFSWEKSVSETLKIYESSNSLRPGQ